VIDPEISRLIQRAMYLTDKKEYNSAELVLKGCMKTLSIEGREKNVQYADLLRIYARNEREAVTFQIESKLVDKTASSLVVSDQLLQDASNIVESLEISEETIVEFIFILNAQAVNYWLDGKNLEAKSKVFKSKQNLFNGKITNLVALGPFLELLNWVYRFDKDEENNLLKDFNDFSLKSS
jgi:hypothetical protein